MYKIIIFLVFVSIYGSHFVIQHILVYIYIDTFCVNKRDVSYIYDIVENILKLFCLIYKS